MSRALIDQASHLAAQALYVGHLFHQAGLPAGVLNILPGFGETAGNALAMHNDVDKVGSGWRFVKRINCVAMATRRCV